MDNLKGVVEYVTFQNPENGYSVLKVAVEGYGDLIPFIGYFFNVAAGSTLRVEGSWKNDPKYGRQFMVENREESTPASVYAIERYLASDLIKGIGREYARKIVDKFELQTIDILDYTQNPPQVAATGRRTVCRGMRLACYKLISHPPEYKFSA